jgi:hypothetical protein
VGARIGVVEYGSRMGGGGGRGVNGMGECRGRMGGHVRHAEMG